MDFEAPWNYQKGTEITSGLVLKNTVSEFTKFFLCGNAKMLTDYFIHIFGKLDVSVLYLSDHLQ